MTSFEKARALALGVPLLLIAGALGSQYIGGLYPCEMCHWQRWPHYDAIVLGVLAFVAPQGARRLLVWLAALSILVSGLIGGWHAGVEYGWWEGITHCTQTGGGSGDILKDIIAAPIIRCDQAQWTLGGVSLAGFNFLISCGAALLIMRLLVKRG
jgi:disulfide bond formation protein DsbB